MLEQEFQFYQDHKNKLMLQYNHRFIVIKDQRVIADYATREEALETTQKEHALGTFLIQRVSAEDDEQVQRFYSRAIFDATPPRLLD